MINERDLQKLALTTKLERELKDKKRLEKEIKDFISTIPQILETAAKCGNNSVFVTSIRSNKKWFKDAPILRTEHAVERQQIQEAAKAFLDSINIKNRIVRTKHYDSYEWALEAYWD